MPARVLPDGPRERRTEHEMNVDPIRYAMKRAYAFVEAQQQALDEGRITEAEWFFRA